MAVYLPTLYCGAVAIDDKELIDGLINLYQNINLKRLFLPEDSGLYYRPLLILTYLIDYSI